MRRKGLIIAAAVLVILLVAAVALPFVVDVNRFRPTLEKEAQAALGRPVQIGELGLSLMAGGIRADDIAVADDQRYSRQPFLRAKSLDVGVRLWPLLVSRELAVTSLTLVEPEVVLLRAPDGKWNFSSLGAAQPSKDAARKPAAPAEFSVGRLNIVNGRVTLGTTAANSKRYTYEAVNVEARDISFRSVVPFTLEATPPGGGSIHAEGRAGPLNRDDLAATPLEARTRVEGLDLAQTGLLDASSGLAGVLDQEGTVKSDGEKLHAEGKVTTTRLRVVKTGAPARQPVVVEYAKDYDLKKGAGTLSKGNIIAGKTFATLTGRIAEQGKTFVLHLKMKGQKLPVDEVQGLLPAFGVVLPPGSSLHGGTVDADLSIDGPLERLVTTGTVNVSNTKLAGFNLGSKMSAVSALAGVKTGNDTMIQTMASGLRISPEGIRADNLSVIVPEIGTVTGGGTISGNNALNFKMRAQLASTNLLSGVSAVTSFGQSKGAIPFLIQGTTSNPVFLPDVAGAMGQTVAAPKEGVSGIMGLFGRKKKE